VLFGESEQERVEVRAFVVAEGSEELVVNLPREPTESPEYPLAVSGKADEVPAAVVGIATALDEPPLFEFVKQPDELAAVVAQRVGDGALRLARALSEDEENGVVVGVEARALVRLHCPLLGGEAQALHQERGGRDQLLRQLGRRRCLWACNGHVK